MRAHGSYTVGVCLAVIGCSGAPEISEPPDPAMAFEETQPCVVFTDAERSLTPGSTAWSWYVTGESINLGAAGQLIVQFRAVILGDDETAGTASEDLVVWERSPFPISAETTGKWTLDFETEPDTWADYMVVLTRENEVDAWSATDCVQWSGNTRCVDRPRDPPLLSCEPLGDDLFHHP